MARGRSEPELPTVDVARLHAARALAYLYLVGSVLAALVLLLPNSAHANETEAWYLIAASGISGIFMGLTWRKIPAWTLHPLLLGGTTAITGAVYLSGLTISPYSMFYLWVVTYAFYFFDTRAALLHLASVALAYAAVIEVLMPGGTDERWVMTVGSLGAIGPLIGLAKRRAETLISQLEATASSDPLTGVLNRRGFAEALRERVQMTGHDQSDASPAAVAVEHRFAVLMADVDYFKDVNDGYGHLQGDATLATVAWLLQNEAHNQEVLARMGGEEFAIIMPTDSSADAFHRAEYLREQVETFFAQSEARVTLSFGVAVFGIHGDSEESVIHAADQALYASKELGRNRTTLYGDDVVELLRTASRRRTDGAENHIAMVLNLAEALDLRDGNTANHSQTVGAYAAAMAEQLGLGDRVVERMRLAGILHDIGKIGIPDAVLLKPGGLTEEEFDLMKRHPEIGARILSGKHFDEVRSWVLAHHERPDGMGYPKGLTNDQIPLPAKILAVADSYEAMTADRVYRDSIGHERAQAELMRCAGSQFDPTVVEAFLHVVDHLIPEIQHPSRPFEIDAHILPIVDPPQPDDVADAA